MANQQRGFTLPELMTVLLIIAILAVISGPVYKSYKAKGKFTQAFTEMSAYKDQLLDAYTKYDYFPSTVANLTANTYVVLTSTALKLAYYQVGTNAVSGYISFYTLDLGVDSYVAPANNGTGGSKCRVTVAAVPNTTGQIQVYCGQWDGSSTDVPLTYLPNGCQDTNISALIT